MKDWKSLSHVGWECILCSAAHNANIIILLVCLAGRPWGNKKTCKKKK